MKRITVFLTFVVVLVLSSLALGPVQAAEMSLPSYTLNNKQSVTGLLPITDEPKWNVLYQLNLSTPVVTAIAYQPELHIFVSENFASDITSIDASISATASESAVATPAAELKKAPPATSAAVAITIDKSNLEIATPEAKPSATPKPTATPVPVALPESDLDSLFEKYAGQYGVSAIAMKHIAQCESGLNPGSLSKNGLYGGLFQFVSSTWSGNRRAMGEDPDPNLRFNAEEAIKTAAFKISRDGYGAWPVCGKKAMAAAI